MIPLSIYDLNEPEALAAARRFRRSFLHPLGLHNTQHPSEIIEGDDEMRDALKLVGGRLSHVNKMCKASPEVPDGLVGFAKGLVDKEKGWLLSQIGLISDHDDDVMDEVCYKLGKISFLTNRWLIDFLFLSMC